MLTEYDHHYVVIYSVVADVIAVAVVEIYVAAVISVEDYYY